KVSVNTGSVNSEGDVAEKANVARATFGVTGAGVKVGVISDSVDYLTNSQALGDLGAVTVLSGQSGIPGTGEGTAMLEIIHDIAPGATLYFSTGNGGPANFANNIRQLRAAGCDIIVDDLEYYNESPFQDAVIAQAVNEVTADGALYFSSASNSGNKDDGTSATWEGDFLESGQTANTGKSVGKLHSFGSGVVNLATSSSQSETANFFWADPLGHSSNDYDIFILDASGANLVAASTTTQNGTQDPYEMVKVNNGEQIVLVLSAGTGRFLHLENGRGRLSVSTAGRTKGHACAADAFGVAAVSAHSVTTPFTAAAKVETFSSDGPRQVFYYANGTAITPGNFSSTGGTVRQKPDLAAADGVATAVPHFQPFYGTSAAAPHAGAIAALLKARNPSLTTSEARAALTTGVLDIEAAGRDRDSGVGLLMADLVLQAVGIAQAPTITGFAPTAGPVGTTVTLSGTKFSGATAVRFNGVSAVFTVISTTNISATVPTGAATGSIAVTTPDGTATSAGSFVVSVAPAITGFTPASGNIGTIVTLTGANFTGSTAVRGSRQCGFCPSATGG
ncbi:MAG: S8 family serine peptidase, partial [Verrucomicrobia bacterium]|nr:S8 family serine peptidase [Verrucomicrobiota bacterium]